MSFPFTEIVLSSSLVNALKTGAWGLFRLRFFWNLRKQHRSPTLVSEARKPWERGPHCESRCPGRRRRTTSSLYLVQKSNREKRPYFLRQAVTLRRCKATIAVGSAQHKGTHALRTADHCLGHIAVPHSRSTRAAVGCNRCCWSAAGRRSDSHSTNGVSYEARHIKDDNPTVEEMKAWQRQSSLPLRRFFNTSGLQS